MINENLAKSHLERNFKNAAGESVIILEDFDFLFSKKELIRIKELWLEQVPISEIERVMKRNKHEVFLALYHLSLSNSGKKKDNIIFRVSQLRG